MTGQCLICGARISRRARTCSGRCRTELHRRLRANLVVTQVPADPVGRAAWEADRRRAAGEAANWLDRVAAGIPTAPADAGRLRRRCADLAEDLRATFLLPGAPLIVQDPTPTPEEDVND